MNKFSVAALGCVFLALLLAVALGGCTVTPDSYPVATVNGEPVSLKDVESFPGFKNLVDELIRRRLIAQKASQLGIEAKPERVNEEIEKMKEQIGPGPSFQQWLVQTNMTEEELRRQIGVSVMFEELLKRQVDVTEEEVKAKFEQNPKFFRQLYARENNLTSEESDNLTFDEMKDWLIDYVKRSRGYSQAQDMMDQIMEEADIEYLFMAAESRAALKKQQAEKRKQKVAAEQPPITIQENGSAEQPSEAGAEAQEPAQEGAAAGEAAGGPEETEGGSEAQPAAEDETAAGADESAGETTGEEGQKAPEQ